MMTDYEHILVSAVRYALGRRSYIVEKTIDYVASQLPKLSDSCIEVMLEDIDKADFEFRFDRKTWECLTEQLQEEMEKRYGTVDWRNL